MWTRLRTVGQPESLYVGSGRYIGFFALCCFVLLLIGWIWGLGFAPTHYEQGDGFRILYVHVPAAMWSMASYLFMAVAAFVGYIWQSKLANQIAASIAPVGAVFTFIALVTGAIWGKPMWGAWWVWDARLTSELILLFLYLGAIALYNAFDDRRLAARAAGILILVGVINLPIIHYSVEWWNSLHQSSTRMQQTIDPAMRTPLRVCIFGYMMFFITLTLMRLRNQLLADESNNVWIDKLMNKEKKS